jgi:DNA-binding response OmpR family regulator
VGHLYYKLVSVGSLHPGRVIIDSTVDAAIDDLKRMEDIVGKAKAEGKAGPKSQAELDRISIEQLAKTLETEVALEAKEVRVAKEKFPTVETPETVETVHSKAAPASSLPRILVVDDSPTIRAAVTKALKNDFSFVQASDGEEAWKLLKNDDSIQLVITDLMMPNLDGFELIKRIRSDRTSSRVAEIPIIVVTTLEATNAKLRALVAGANDFVTKSTDAVELKMRVMARYEVAQSEKMLAHGRAQAAPQRAPQERAQHERAQQAPMTAAQVMHAAAQVAHAAPPPRAAQAPMTTTPRNGSSAGAMAGSGSSAAMARFPDPGTAKPEARRPISPAAISAPVSSVVQTIGYGKLGQTIESGKALLDRL